MTFHNLQNLVYTDFCVDGTEQFTQPGHIIFAENRADFYDLYIVADQFHRGNDQIDFLTL